MTLPQAEEHLSQHLGSHYKNEDWRHALKAVMDAEGDIVKAQQAIQKISATCEQPKLKIKLPARPSELVASESMLANSVRDLQKRNRIFGELPSVDDLLNPIEERQVEDSPHAFPGGDNDIVKQVEYESKVQSREIIEVDDDDDDDDEDLDPNVTRRDTIELVAQLERLTIKFGDGNKNADTLHLNHDLRKFRAFLHKEEFRHGKQTHIDSYFTS